MRDGQEIQDNIERIFGEDLRTPTDSVARLQLELLLDLRGLLENIQAELEGQRRNGR